MEGASRLEEYLNDLTMLRHLSHELRPLQASVSGILVLRPARRAR